LTPFVCFWPMDTRVGCLTGLHVLEDDRDARAILTEVLYLGALVTATETASEALRILRAISPAVIVADIQLPDHSAPWLVREAKARGFTVPFVAVSGLDFDERELLAQGFEAYLRKPVDYLVLVDTLLAVARRGR